MVVGAGGISSYLRQLATMDYPKKLISIGILEGDSTDDTFASLKYQREIDFIDSLTHTRTHCFLSLYLHLQGAPSKAAGVPECDVDQEELQL